LPGTFGGGQGITSGWSASRHGASLLSENRKARARRAFFLLYSISSGYQIERINPPNIFEGIRV
jgi:hypothetical protein